MTRHGFVLMLMANGFHYRESRKIVTAFVDSMKEALQRGEEIELPFGTLRPIPNKRPRRQWQWNRIIITNKHKYRYFVRQRDPWI